MEALTVFTHFEDDRQCCGLNNEGYVGCFGDGSSEVDIDSVNGNWPTINNDAGKNRPYGERFSSISVGARAVCGVTFVSSDVVGDEALANGELNLQPISQRRPARFVAKAMGGQDGGIKPLFPIVSSTEK